MNQLPDKTVVLGLCAAAAFLRLPPQEAIIPALAAVAAGGFSEYVPNGTLRLCISFGWLAAALLYAPCAFFLPLFALVPLQTQHPFAALLFAAPLLVHLQVISPPIGAVLLLVFAAGWRGTLRNREADALQKENNRQRDDLIELSRKLESRVEQLIESQDYEVRLATLHERGRIARDIHDTVGHLLSSAILQIGALLTVTNDPAMQGSLQAVKETLDQGMNSIRESVHGLHEESLDLYAQLDALVREFRFCQAKLRYELASELPVKARYAVLSIVREGLHNIVRHSNATQATVSLLEHPQLVQLTIRDNGTQSAVQDASGMGLDSIAQRVAALDGHLHIDHTQGFCLFISFTKKALMIKETL